MKVRYYKGTDEAKTFAAGYLRHDGLLRRFSALLAARQRQWLGIMDIAPDGGPPDAPTEYESKAPGPGAKRKRVDDAPAQKKAKQSRAEIVLKAAFRYEEKGRRKGKYYYIDDSDHPPVNDADKYHVLEQMLGAVEGEIGEVLIQICDEKGFATEAYDDPKAKDDTFEVLDELALPPFMAMGALGYVPLWRRNASDFKEVMDGSEESWVVRMLAPDPFPPMPCICDRAAGPNASYDADMVGEIKWRTPSAVKDRYGLWIPDAIPLFFFDTRDTTLYVADGDVCRTSTAVKSGKIACYGLIGGELRSIILTIPVAPYWPPWGVGGQGAMRCDRSREFRCSVEDNGRLAAALGLRTFKLSQTKVLAQEIVYPWQGYAAKLRYRKVYEPSIDKKNEPKETKPLTWADVRKPQELETFGLTRKRKGDKVDSAGVHRSGERTQHPQRARTAAAQAMQDSLQQRFGKDSGVDLKDWKGSANDLVRIAFAKDAVLRATWKKESANLRMLDGKPVQDFQKEALRTDQEWCHLVGHGDGGPEVEANFVSGSKHCNTEQLALELAQRVFRERGIVLKVTAYLLTGKTWRNEAALEAVLERFPSCARIFLADPTQGGGDTSIEALFLDMREKLEAAFLIELMKTKQKTRSFNFGHVTVSWPKNLNVLARIHRSKVMAEETLNYVYNTMPIAYKMRYKVYVKTTSGAYEKAIDHVFHGQREEMDFNEFRLLQWAFRLRIAHATGSKEEIEYTERLVTDLVAAREAADGT